MPGFEIKLYTKYYIMNVDISFIVPILSFEYEFYTNTIRSDLSKKIKCNSVFNVLMS